MKKIFLFIVLVFVFVACGNNGENNVVNSGNRDNGNGFAKEPENTIPNLDLDSKGIYDIKFVQDISPEFIDDFDNEIIEGYHKVEKSGYIVEYKIRGQEEVAQQVVRITKRQPPSDDSAFTYSVMIYRNNDNVSRYSYCGIDITNEARTINYVPVITINSRRGDCDIRYPKFYRYDREEDKKFIDYILKAIENKTYFDY